MAFLCKIELLGGLSLTRGEQITTRFRTQKTGELLAYLAYFRQRMHPREILIELLWPEDDVNAGRHSLSMALSSLRTQLEPPGMTADDSVLIANRHSVGLNSLAVTTDTAEFEAALASTAHVADEAERVRSLATAVEMYGGDLLPGYYNDWIFPEQQRLEESLFEALRQLIVLLERSGDLSGALQYALRLVSADRLSEAAHQEVIRLYSAAGQSAAAERQFRELERILQKDIGAVPSTKTRGIIHAIQLRESGSAIPRVDDQAAIAVSVVPPPSVTPLIRTEQLEPVGGAVPLHCAYYVVRPADEEFHAAIARRDSIVLVKGARQMGKTSLLARGLQWARQAGAHVVLTHFQMFNAANLASADALLLGLAETIAEQLDLDVPPADVWDIRRGPNLNFRRYLRREVLSKLSAPLIWGIDEVDRLFTCSFGGEIFGLFRSWHDERALEPDGPWEKVTMAMAYSTEAHLFITDINQSPFNVGTHVALEDFTPEQVADINRRYGEPLRNAREMARYYGLVNGHPYLVRRGLHEMVAHGTSLATFEVKAGSDDWIYGEHLRRIAALLVKNPELSNVVRLILEGKPCPAREDFYRLRSAGILAGESWRDADFRCPLYAAYLQQSLS